MTPPVLRRRDQQMAILDAAGIPDAEIAALLGLRGVETLQRARARPEYQAVLVTENARHVERLRGQVLAEMEARIESLVPKALDVKEFFLDHAADYPSAADSASNTLLRYAFGDRLKGKTSERPKAQSIRITVEQQSLLVQTLAEDDTPIDVTVGRPRRRRAPLEIETTAEEIVDVEDDEVAEVG